MSNPTPYNPSYSFSDYQTANPSEPLPAPQLDNELADVSQAMTETQTALADIRRSDGALVNNIVTADAIGNTQVQTRHLAFGALGTTPKATTAQATAGTDNEAFMTSAATKAALVYPQIRTPIWMPGRDYSLPVGGGTGTAAAINAAMAAVAASRGGKIMLPPEVIFLDGTIDNKYSLVTIEGMGSATRSDVGENIYSTVIVPTFSGTAIKHRTPYGGPTTRKNHRGGFTKLSVVGNSIATRLLEVDSINQGEYDLYLSGCVSPGGEAALFTSGVTGVDLGDAADVQACTVKLNIIQVSDTGPNAGNCNGVRFDGSANANFSLNREIDIFVRHEHGNGIVLSNTDNNVFNAVVCQRTPGGTGRSFVSLGGDVLYSRRNVIEYYSANSTAYVQGTDGGANPSSLIIHNLDVDNSTPMPEYGPLASVPVLNASRVYTPVVSSSSGAITTAAASATWFTTEHLVTVIASVSVTTNGSGSGSIRITLPVPEKSTGLVIPGIVHGVEVAATQKGIIGTVESGYASFRFYDGTYPGADGRVFRVQFTYERE